MNGFHYRTTERGYLVCEFTDSMNIPCSIQQAAEQRVRLLADNPMADMHLNREQAAQLGALLTAFAASGDLRTAVELLALGVERGGE